MLINDVDIQARWRVRAKDEWIAAQSGRSAMRSNPRRRAGAVEQDQ
jgi:hypothetical protein